MVYQDSRPPATQALKSNSKFEILLVKIFSLKQKANQILPVTVGKIKFCLFNSTAHSSRQGITMGTCKTKALQADLGIFTHILAYSGIIQAYSELCFIQNPDILKTRGIFRFLVYSEHWYIQNPGIF